MPNTLPAVLVHGMFGFGPTELGGLSYWGTALEAPSSLPRIEASVGPLSSPHDRACELAAQLKGTRVDYGETHAAAHGHGRFGREYGGQGLWPAWSDRRPLHMIGHSLGASTIRALHALLVRDYWEWGSNERWVASLSSISGPLNGTTLVYALGADPSSGLLRRGNGIAPLLQSLALIDALGPRELKEINDLDLGQWYAPRNDSEPLPDYLRRLGQTPFLWGPDNAFYSVSLQSAWRDNARWPTYPATYYFSYVTEQTFQLWPRGHFYPSPLMNSALYGFSWQLGRLEPDLRLPGGGELDFHKWWENDGLVPTYSQLFPHTNGQHPVGFELTPETPVAALKPGRWYWQWQRGFDHAAICTAPRPWQKGRQKRFYQQLFERLGSLTID